MVKKLEPTARAYMHNKMVNKRYVRVDEMTEQLKAEYPQLYAQGKVWLDEIDGWISELTKYLAIAAGALYRLPRTELIHQERLEEYMKHLYRVPGTNKQVIKKFVRIGEGSIIYGIGCHRFIEMARAAGATYKINEATGGMVLVNLELFDEYMEQFRQEPVPMKHPLFKAGKDGE